MTSKQKGTITEPAILLRALKKGLSVSIPIGNYGKYDLVFDDGRSLRKVQCKTGCLKRDSFRFRPASANQAGWRAYQAEEVDDFAVYVPEHDKVYLVPFEEVKGRWIMTFHFSVPKNGQQAKILMAKDFEF